MSRRPNPPLAETRRIGLIVASSNVVIEPEISSLMVASDKGGFSFHASRLRELAFSSSPILAASVQRERCLLELGDAKVDAILDTVLTPLWLGGPEENARSLSAMAEQLANGGLETRVRSVAGALVEALQSLEATRIALVVPQSRVKVDDVAQYFEAEGFEVSSADVMSETTTTDPLAQSQALMDVAARFDLNRADSLVLATDVNVPSVHLIESAEERFALPIVTGTSAGSFSLLRALGIEAVIPSAGKLLANSRRIPVS